MLLCNTTKARDVNRRRHLTAGNVRTGAPEVGARRTNDAQRENISTRETTKSAVS